MDCVSLGVPGEGLHASPQPQRGLGQRGSCSSGPREQPLTRPAEPCPSRRSRAVFPGTVCRDAGWAVSVLLCVIKGFLRRGASCSVTGCSGGEGHRSPVPLTALWLCLLSVSHPSHICLSDRGRFPPVLLPRPASASLGCCLVSFFGDFWRHLILLFVPVVFLRII